MVKDKKVIPAIQQDILLPCCSDFTCRLPSRIVSVSLAWRFIIGCLGQTCWVATLERKPILFRRGQRRQRIKGQECRKFPIPTTFDSASCCPDRKPLCLFLKEQADTTNKLNSSPFFHSKSYKEINNLVTNCKTIFDSLPVLGEPLLVCYQLGYLFSSINDVSHFC
jgi:hypothetical protein